MREDYTVLGRPVITGHKVYDRDEHGDDKF